MNVNPKSDTVRPELLRAHYERFQEIRAALADDVLWTRLRIAGAPQGMGPGETLIHLAELALPPLKKKRTTS